MGNVREEYCNGQICKMGSSCFFISLFRFVFNFSFHFLRITLFRFVLVDFVLLSLVSFHFIFISLISFRFVFVDFVSFLFHFTLYRYPDLDMLNIFAV